MKRIILLGLLVRFCWTVQAQEEPLSYPGFQLLRAEENWSILKKDTFPRTLWRRLKYLSLSDSEDAWLSIGGNVRSEFQFRINEDWQPGNDDLGALFQRFMLHSDWHFSESFRLFGELKSGFTVDRNGPPLPLDKDLLDIHQLFAEWRWPLLQSSIRIGRQELWYGSRRLISIREGTNVRQSFDGVRWIRDDEHGRLDLLFFLYNPQRTGVFDNRVSDEQLLWGAYYVWKMPASAHQQIDVYYLGVRNEAMRFDDGSDRELRHSLGLRHWGEKEGFSFNSEAVLQFGAFGDRDILAWTLSTELAYTLPNRSGEPTFGLKGEFISGDLEQGDNRLQTFNPLYPRGGYFGLLALIGPANLMDIHPSFRYKLTDKLVFGLDWDFFWRYSLNDGIYFPSGRLNVGSQGSRERFIGHQPGGELVYTVSRFLELSASCYHFFTGPFIREVTEGADYTQINTSVNFKF